MLINRPGGAANNKARRKIKGCWGGDTIAQRVVPNKKTEIQFKRCVGNFWDAGLTMLLDAKDCFDKGVMPYPGSSLEQPNKIIEVFALIREYKTTKLKEEQQKVQQRQQGGRR